MKRKILSALLVFCLILSIIPTTVFATPTENNITLLQENAVAAKNSGALTATSKYAGTNLQTAFEGNAFETRKANNLVALGNVVTKASLEGNAIYGTLNSYLYDGLINVDSVAAPKYGDNTSFNGTDPQGYITVALDSVYNISNIYSIGHHVSAFAIWDYEIYVSTSEAELYTSNNLVATFKYTAYQGESMSATGGKLNGAGLSEGQIFTFAGSEQPRGAYVGFKVIRASKHSSFPHFFFVSELGIEGEKYVDPYVVSFVDSNAGLAATSGKLTVTSNFANTYLQTAFDGNYFSQRKDLNLVASSDITTKSTLTGVNLFEGQRPALFDGIISTGDANVSKYGDTKSFKGTDPQGYITLSMSECYEIDNIYLIGHHGSSFAIWDYEIYVSKTISNLYANKNKVATFKYTGYTANSMSATGGKLNANGISEGQIFKFNGEIKPQGAYVGFKINRASSYQDYPSYFLLTEIGVEKANYYTIDESELNDDTKIIPTKATYHEGDDYTFKVEMKNNNALKNLYLDGVEITPDEDGVYTVKNPNKTMKLTAKTSRDEFATVDGIWTDANGKEWNLNKKTTAHDSVIWDSDVQFFETVSFWEGETYKEIETRLSTKLLYPIDEIIKVQSYDLKTTYYEGEDFEIKNGEFHLTENSRIPVYGRGEGETLKDMAILKEDGDVDWSSNHGGSIWWAKTFWKYQICVTYTHNQIWSENDIYTQTPESKIDKIEAFDKKAKSGAPTNVLFIGSSNVVGHTASNMGAPETFRVADSVTGEASKGDYKSVYKTRTPETTSNFSSKYTQEELAEWGGYSWRVQVENAIANKYGDNISFTNCAVSSSTTEWHKNNMEFLYGTGEGSAGTPTPDLVIIATGGNEQERSGVEFVANCKEVIELLQSRNPDCCFVLVNGLYINRRDKASGEISTFKMLDQEAECLKVERGTSTVITDNKNIISAPNYSFYKSLANNKTVFDGLADTLNHPNDFGHTAIANLVNATIGIYDECEHESGTYVDGKVSATCSKEGYTGDTYCDDCDEMVAKGTNVSCPRSSTTVKNKKTATCTAKGYTGDTYCNTCGELVKKGTATNVVAHKSVTKVTKATLSKNGKITYTCSVCKKATKTSTTVYYPKTIKLSTTTYTYNGKAKKPTVKVTGSNGKTISGSNYTVSYASGRKYPDKYKVTVKFKGNYEGTKTLYFKVKPKKASLSSVKSTAKKKATVKWSKQSGVTGYEILLATNSKFTKGKKTVTVKGSSSKSKTIKSLKSKKTYYVKVRAYKTIDGKKVYGSYSKYKKVKVK